MPIDFNEELIQLGLVYKSHIEAQSERLNSSHDNLVQAMQRYLDDLTKHEKTIDRLCSLTEKLEKSLNLDEEDEDAS